MIRWTHLNDKSNIHYELYDYEKDPLEIVNISKENQDLIQEMSKLLNLYPAPKRIVKGQNKL